MKEMTKKGHQNFWVDEREEKKVNINFKEMVKVFGGNFDRSKVFRFCAVVNFP